jgi:hypothetical protein
VVLAASVALVPPASSSSSSPSFYAGPAGRDVILPPRKGVLLGATQSGVSESVPSQLARLESSIGRRVDIEHRYMQGTCSLEVGVIKAAARRGHIPMVSWFPNPSLGGEVLRGDADACIRNVGRQIARQPHKLLLRPYWEFNGYWMPWSKDTDGSLLTTDEFKRLWTRTIDRLREGGAFPKASVVWCPSAGYYNNPNGSLDAKASYPGDSYVDWVCADDFNHVGDGVWREIADLFHPPQNVEHDFRGRKPFLVGETGSIEDPSDPNRKGNWFRNARRYIKSSMPGMRGFVYFDVAYTDGDWRIGTTSSSLGGLRDLARDPYFDTLRRRVPSRPR